jgi:hypothetical protein
MRATVASGVVVVLVATMSPVPARAESGESLRTSIEATAKAFANSQSAGDAAMYADWKRLGRLKADERIAVRTRDGHVVYARFLEADDISLAARAGALQRSFARAEILEVSSAPLGSRAGAYIGTSIGIMVGILVGGNISLGCAPHCTGSDNAGAWLAVVGLPVGLGFTGYYGLRESPEVIYHAP